MLDLNAAREAAEYVVDHECEFSEECVVAARYLLWLTDTTPLTWDVVCKEPGFVIAHPYAAYNTLTVRYAGDGRLRFFAGHQAMGSDLAPRTLGELRWLIRRTSEPS